MSISCPPVDKDSVSPSRTDIISAQDGQQGSLTLLNPIQTIMFRHGSRQWRMSIHSSACLEDPARLDALLTLLGRRIESAPIDARFAWDDIAHHVQVVPGQAGIVLDWPAAAQSIATALATGTSATISLPVISAAPAITTARLLRLVDEANALVLSASIDQRLPFNTARHVATLHVSGQPLTVEFAPAGISTNPAEHA